MRRQRNLLGPQGMGGLVSLWGQSSLIKSIQRGTIFMSVAQTSNTASINAVDLANSVLRFCGQTNGGAGDTTTAYALAGISVVGTTVTATRISTFAGGTNCTASWELVEYFPGVFKSIQRGTKLFIGAAAATQAITEVNPNKSVLESVGLTGDGNGFSGTYFPYGVMTNGTTITYTSGYTGGALTFIVYWQVLEQF